MRGFFLGSFPFLVGWALAQQQNKPRHSNFHSNALYPKQLDMYESRTKEDSEKTAESSCSCQACGKRAVMYLGDVSESKVKKRLRIMLPWDNGS